MLALAGFGVVGFSSVGLAVLCSGFVCLCLGLGVPLGGSSAVLCRFGVVGSRAWALGFGFWG